MTAQDSQGTGKDSAPSEGETVEPLSKARPGGSAVPMPTRSTPSAAPSTRVMPPVSSSTRTSTAKPGGSAEPIGPAPSVGTKKRVVGAKPPTVAAGTEAAEAEADNKLPFAKKLVGALSDSVESSKTAFRTNLDDPGLAPRRVRLTVHRIDPWSALKLSFLLSIAFAIAIVIGSIVLWWILNAMGIFSSVNSLMVEVMGTTSDFNLNEFVELSRVIGIVSVVAVIEVVLITALGTLSALLYNLIAKMVGGLQLTLTDD